MMPVSLTLKKREFFFFTLCQIQWRMFDDAGFSHSQKTILKKCVNISGATLNVKHQTLNYTLNRGVINGGDGSGALHFQGRRQHSI